MTERGFEGLQFYQDSLTLLRAAYRLADKLPEYERYNLSDQMRRAVTSVVLNIAEGYGRYHYLDRLKFLYIARASVDETLSCFIIAEQLGYCDSTQLEWVRQQVSTIERKLNGYCRLIRRQQRGREEFGDQQTPNQLSAHELGSENEAEQTTH